MLKKNQKRTGEIQQFVHVCVSLAVLGWAMEMSQQIYYYRRKDYIDPNLRDLQSKQKMFKYFLAYKHDRRQHRNSLIHKAFIWEMY